MKSIYAISVMVFLLIALAEAQQIYPRPMIPYYRVTRSVELDNGRVQRQAGDHHHHDVTDFGAHTGHHGAFGWYADFPVHAHGN